MLMSAYATRWQCRRHCFGGKRTRWPSQTGAVSVRARSVTLVYEDKRCQRALSISQHYDTPTERPWSCDGAGTSLTSGFDVSGDERTNTQTNVYWILAAVERLQKMFLPQYNQHFYLDVLVSVRDLHQKKLVQFFRFLPRYNDVTWQEIGRTCGSACSCPRPVTTVVARTGRRTEQASSNKGLW